jgi:hypothetical protein
MNTQTIESARLMRDGGIAAMSALNLALNEALVGVPLENARALKLAVGDAMGEISLKIINPAVQAFPELELDESGWNEVARLRACARCNRAV